MIDIEDTKGTLQYNWLYTVWIQRKKVRWVARNNDSLNLLTASRKLTKKP